MNMKKAAVLFVMLTAVCAAQAATAQEIKTGAVTGTIMLKGAGPMAGGLVFLFNDASGPPPSPDRYWRVPDEIVPTNHEGKFTAELVAGRYYLGAIKRQSGQRIGPPEEGDFFFTSTDKGGKPKAYSIKKGETLDIGVVADAVPFKKSPATAGVTAIEGVVLGVDGKPVDGALVFAFLTPAMVGKPLFVSERTGKDGRYILRVHEGGKYYLKVRDVYGGGPPEAGNVIGGHGEKEPVGVVVKSGDAAKAIDITVIRFPGRGPKQE